MGKCETSLKKHYNISNNEKLYIQKIDIIQEGIKVPKIEYQVFAKLSNNNLEKLNISVCQDIKINLLLPVEINDNLDKYDGNSEYCNDKCFVSKSKDGVDTILKDRQNECANNIVCQNDCLFTGYNNMTKKVNCSCDVKEKSKSFSEMNINKNQLLDNFKNFKNIANVGILSCFKNLFSKSGIIKNMGFYIVMTIIIFHIIAIFVFGCRKKESLKKIIKDIILAIKNVKLLDKKEKKKGKMSEKKKAEENANTINDNKKYKNQIININNEENKKDNKILIKKKENKRKGKERYKRNNNRDKRIKAIHLNMGNDTITNNNPNSNNILSINNKRNKKRNITRNNASQNISKANEKNKIIKRVQKILQYNDDEINDLCYEEALENDNRTYCLFYFSLMKTNHSFIYTFFYNKDYNSKIIKIDLFFVIFASNYAVNTLFYSDETMHNRTENKGSLNIEYQLPKIIYSTLISSFLEFLLKLLALSSDAIIEFKKTKKSKILMKEKNN